MSTSRLGPPVAVSLLFLCGCASRTPGTIATDRPGFLFSTALVPEGAFQVEAGTPLVALDEQAGVDVAQASTPVQLRYGLSPSLELRVGSPVFNRFATDPGPDESGFGDVEIGAKIPLSLPLGQDGAALIAGLRLPVGGDPFAADGPSPSLNAVSSWALDELTSITGLMGVSYLPVDGGDDPVTGSLAALVSRSLGAGWTGAVEAIWFPARHAPDTAYAGVWATRLLGDAWQLDASVHRGLDEDASDWLLGVGISWRW